MGNQDGIVAAVHDEIEALIHESLDHEMEQLLRNHKSENIHQVVRNRVKHMEVFSTAGYERMVRGIFVHVFIVFI